MMKKADLQDLARFGVRFRLQSIERVLRELHRAFPEEFASATPPVLVKPEAKANGNSWPEFTVGASESDGNGSKPQAPQGKAWTPERRAKQGRLIKKRLAATSAWGEFGWHRVHDFLKTQPKKTATVKDIMAAAKINTQATLVSLQKIHPAVFQRISPGIYKLKKEVAHS